MLPPLRSWLGFWLYRAMGGNWASRTQYVELFVTPGGGQPLRYPEDYLGLYLSMEHINRVGPGRVIFVFR